MSDKPSRRMDKSSGVRSVTTVAIEMRNGIIELAGPRAWGQNRKSWLNGAAEAAGISYRAAKALFYCEREDAHSSTVEAVRSAVQRARLAAQRVQQEQEAQARAEFRELVARINDLAARLDQVDAHFHRPQADALRRQVPVGGGKVRPLGEE